MSDLLYQNGIPIHPTLLGSGVYTYREFTARDQQQTVTSTSFTNTWLNSYITPSSINSKLFVSHQFMYDTYTTPGGAGTHYYTASLFRRIGGGAWVNIMDSNWGGAQTLVSGGSSQSRPECVLQTIDSPNTTSSVEYSVFVRCSLASAGIYIWGRTSIMLMEIQG